MASTLPMAVGIEQLLSLVQQGSFACAGTCSALQRFSTSVPLPALSSFYLSWSDCLICLLPSIRGPTPSTTADRNGDLHLQLLTWNERYVVLFLGLPQGPRMLPIFSPCQKRAGIFLNLTFDSGLFSEQLFINFDPICAPFLSDSSCNI